MPQLKNIIFDLGGVLFNIDYNLTADAFRALGLKHFDAIYSQKKQDHFFDRFETGELPVETFRAEIRNHLSEPATDMQIDAAWNAMLIGIPESRYPWLAETGRTYRIFLLSNTNTIHVTALSEMIDRQYGMPKFEALFEKIYFSCNLGMRKPDAEIFDHLIGQNNLDKAETLFIDDSIQHIDGARAAGIPAMHLEPGQQVEQLMERIMHQSA